MRRDFFSTCSLMTALSYLVIVNMYSREIFMYWEIEDMFDNVIGYDNIKRELCMICDMIVNFENYKAKGVEPVKGVLLHGRPGTGKTTMVTDLIDYCRKETDFPVYVIRKDKPQDGFVDYIRDTFSKAKDTAPSIVFLDDMDKFNTEDFHAEEFSTIQSCIDDVKNSDVFVIATANEIKEFPRSLVRVGRFDKMIPVGNPSKDDRVKIVEFYLKNKGITANIDAEEVARLLDGGSCAELESVIKFATAKAVYEKRDTLSGDDILDAFIRTVYKAPVSDGSTKSKESLEIAYHEAGHALISELLEPDTVNIVSILKNEGEMGGFTSYQQPDDGFQSIEHMENSVISLLGGKAATEVVFGESDPGCSSDLKSAFEIVSKIVDDYCVYGFGNTEMINDVYSSNDLNNRKELVVSFEMDRYYRKAKRIIIENRAFLDRLASELIEKKVITYKTVRQLKMA